MGGNVEGIRRAAHCKDGNGMSASPNVFFDGSLPTFVRALAEHLGVDVLKQGLVVRDSSGRLRFLTSEVPPSEERRVDIEKRIADVLGAYARRDGVIAFKDQPGVQQLLKDPEAFPMQQDSLTFVSWIGASSDRHG